MSIETPSPGAIALRFFLEEHGMSAYRFAEINGFQPRSVQQWAKGDCRPGFDAALRLESITEGQVKARMWRRAR